VRSMIIEKTTLEGVFIIKSSAIRDIRGSFERFFCDEALSPVLCGRSIKQINHSINAEQGVIRGLHYQRPPQAEMKLIRCLKGRVWDVAVDLRKGSNTFLQWFARELTADNSEMMVMPEGVAHGFQTLEPDSHLLYLHTAPYSPSLEGAVAWNDPLLSIDWPQVILSLSERDKKHEFLTEGFEGVLC
jgi:dTDP-4-dehydrorhamnose 3,5-epimerase